jgi:hypothetical protein
MSTLAPKPVIKKILNPKLLTTAAILLMLLALLFLATPLLRSTNDPLMGGNINPQFNGQSLPGGESGFPGSGNLPSGQGFPGQDGSNLPGQQPGRLGGRMGFSILGGMGGTIVYAFALLISLAAAFGMLMTKRWGKVLGIVMAVVYILLALVNLLPTLLMSMMGIRNPWSLLLGFLSLLLALAIIVLASIPGKEPVPPVSPTTPPTIPA